MLRTLIRGRTAGRATFALSALATAAALACGSAAAGRPGTGGARSAPGLADGSAPEPAASLPALRREGEPDTVTALTLLRDRERLVPLPRGLAVLSVSIGMPEGHDEAAGAGAVPEGALREAGWTVDARRFEAGAPPAAYEALGEPVEAAGVVLVGVYGSVLPAPAAQFLIRTELRRPVVLLAFGGVGLLAAAPATGTILLVPDVDPATRRATGRALAGLEPITGTLGADLPPRYVQGEGLMRQVRPPAAAEPLSRTQAGLPTAVNFIELDPAAAGMDPEALDRVDSIILEALADSTAPGAALAVGRRGRIVRLRGYGTIDWAEDRPVTPATLFDLSSLTKVVGTTTAAMLLEAEGRLDLDAPVARYLPWWMGEDSRKRAVTVRQLLVHRSGMPAFRPWFRELRGPAAYREALARERLEHDPGTRTLYSDLGFLALGFVLEAAVGAPLDRLLAERVWSPLDMEDTGFNPDPELLPRIAPTELDTLWRHQHVRGRVHDENADALGGVAGHAGLFSTAWDLAIFADLMLAGGVAPACTPAVRSGVACTRPRSEALRLLSEESVLRWTARAQPSASYALGWDTPEGPSSSAGDFFSRRAFGHTGFTGTSIWIDPELDLFVVLLTNRINPSRANARHVPLRQAVHDAVARAIRDRPVAPRER